MLDATRVRTFLLALIVLVCGVPSSHAQSGTATLSGTITDESGAVVPDVQVTLTNEVTQTRIRKTGGGAGLFTFALMPRGRYVLSTERAGFSPSEVRDLVLNVDDQVHITVTLKVAAVGETVTVAAEPSRINTSPALATVVDRQFVENLPLNGRSFQSLVAVIPGVVFTGQSSPGRGQFSVNGQRTNTNYFMVDGVGANVEVGSAYWPSQEAAGVTPALNAIGGTQSLISADALEEFSIQTSTYSAQHGRQPGGQVSIVSRAGTNQLHGSLFEYFRDDAMDAVNWFVKANNLPRAPMRHHQFGGTVGGSIQLPGYDGRDRSFFFLSYEGLRVVQPRTIQNDVPSLSLREEAWPALRTLLASLPIPTGPEDPATRQAPFVAAYSTPSAFDATSLRVDQQLSAGARLFGRVNYSPSKTTTRNLNNVETDFASLWTTTGGLTQTLGSSLTHDLRFNITTNRRRYETHQDDFGGAIAVTRESILPPGIPASMPTRLQLHLHTVASPYFTLGQFQRQHQLNVVDTWTWTKGSHLVKAGADYRLLRPASQPWEYFYFLRFGNPSSILSGVPSSLTSSIQALERVDLRFRNFAAFVEDTWRASSRLTVDWGLRWDVNPAPVLADGKTFTTLTGLESPETLRVAPPGTPLYPTDWAAFGPRVGGSYVLSHDAGRERVVRGGLGLFNDLGAGTASQAAIGFPFVRNVALPAGLPYPFDAAAVARPPMTSLDPPYTGQTFTAFPEHRTPRTYQWNVTLEQSIDGPQSVTLSYVGAIGRYLLRREVFLLRDPNADFVGATSLEISRSNARSDYAALQAVYRRRLSRGLQALASYTLSKSEDTISDAVSSQPRADRLDPELFRGPSDFDRRHVFSAAVTYAMPAAAFGPMSAFLRDWSVAAIVQAYSAAPVRVYTNRDAGFGSIAVTPDLVPGVPIYLDDQSAPGGRRLNPAAFSVPVEPRMGNLPRNGIRGFPFQQVDISLSRHVPLVSGVRLQIRADVFNVLNTASFSSDAMGFLGPTTPDGVLTPSSSFGRSLWTADNSLGGSNGLYRLYASGGARSVQLSGRLTF